jgi:hypothetical protein
MNLVRRPSQGWLFGLELQGNIHIPWETKMWPYFSILSLAVRLLLPYIYIIIWMQVGIWNEFPMI